MAAGNGLPALYPNFEEMDSEADRAKLWQNLKPIHFAGSRRQGMPQINLDANNADSKRCSRTARGGNLER